MGRFQQRAIIQHEIDMATRPSEKVIKAGKVLLSGNEAVAHSAWEAGVRFATGYPGTPSTEILETLVGFPEVHCEWAPNEKVALETAAGASLGGIRSLVTMKHVGLNVAADPLMTLAYTGVKGGLVVVSADDPGMHSSQNEQDNRNYARFAKVPMFEPADSAEAVEYLKEAYELSERYELPVLFRMTTRICHSKSLAFTGPRADVPPTGYEKDFVRNVMVPANARIMRVELQRKMKELLREVETSALNRIERRGKLGVITSGNIYNYVREALPEVSVLKLGITWPLPAKMIAGFVSSCERTFVVEELDPFLETEIRAMGVPLSATDSREKCRAFQRRPPGTPGNSRSRSSRADPGNCPQASGALPRLLASRGFHGAEKNEADSNRGYRLLYALGPAPAGLDGYLSLHGRLGGHGVRAGTRHRPGIEKKGGRCDR